MRPRSIFPNNSRLNTPMVSRRRPLSMVRTWSQSARESLGRRLSFAGSRGWTRRSTTLPFTDERGTTVTVEEISFASVRETTTQGRVLGTSAPRAGSRRTHTKEPLTTTASLLCLGEQSLDLRDATLVVRNDTPPASELSALFGCAGLPNRPSNCSAGRSKLFYWTAFLLF
jgi:hypothetical protein